MENQTIIAVNRKEQLPGTLFRAKAEYTGTGRILGVTAKTRIVGYETVNGAVKVSLLTSFRLIFRSQEGVFSHETIETEQVETIQAEGLKPTTYLCVQAEVVGSNRIGTSVEAVIEVSGWYIFENNVTFLNACTPGIYCKTAPFKAENVTRILPGGLTLTYTDESRMNIKDLIDYSVEATVNNIFSSEGSYRIEGDVFLRILAQPEEGQCFSQLFSHSFSTEIADDNISSASVIDADVTVKNAGLSLADGDKRLLICDIGLSFCGTYGLPIETEMVVDAFSPTNEITTIGGDVTINEESCLRSVREKVSAKVTPDNGINELFGILCPVVSASFSNNNGTVAIEGTVETDILYLTSGDVAAGQKEEIPFKINLPMDYKCDTKFSPKIIITGINAKTRGSEIDLTVEMTISIKGISSEKKYILSAVEIGAEKEENDFAVSLYIVRKGETLWDVAKALNVSEDTLLQQNTDVPLPLSGGEKIILYKELPFKK